MREEDDGSETGIVREERRGSQKERVMVCQDKRGVDKRRGVERRKSGSL